MYTHQVRSVAWNVPDDFLITPEYNQKTVFFLSFTKILFFKIYKCIFLTDCTHLCMSEVNGTF